MPWYWSPASVAIAAISVVFGMFGLYAVSRRRSSASLALTAAMLAAGWWSFAYCLELSAADLATIRFWGDVKYVGIVALPPAWLLFTLRFTGREDWITPRMLSALAVMPTLTLALLANPATRDLIRFYPPLVPGQELPSALIGPLFWPHALYTYALLLGGVLLLVRFFLRVSPVYRAQSTLLLAVSTLPLVGNVLYALGIEPFERLDPTPFAFLVCSAVLLWGLLRFGLLELVPIARAAIIERMTDAVVVLDVERRIADFNPAAERLLDERGHAVLGRPAAEVLPACADLLDRYAESGDVHTDLQVSTGGRARDYDVAVSPVHDPRGRPAGHLLVLRDVTQRRLAEQRLKYLALYDTLTGLPNRKLFSDRLEDGLRRARRHQRRMALLFCDLDRFKRINDTFGHDTGDEVLRQVGKRLRSVLRAEDTLARLGGDEFVILLPEVERSSDAEWVAQVLVEALAAPVRLDGEDLYLTMSVGVCLYPEDGLDAATLLRHADLTMYRAKSHGRNRFEVRTPESEEQLLEEWRLEQELHGAAQRDELEVWYQPATSLDGGLLAMEALIRWRHPRRGLLLPGEFLPLVDDTELLRELDRWVLRTACRQAARWQHEGRHGPVPVSVNVSGQLFGDPGLREEVMRVLWETGLTPATLVLEIAERVLAAQPELAQQRLRDLRRLGITLAADGFGTGTALLARLGDFGLDMVKIDRAFLQDPALRDDDGAHLRGIIQQARHLGLTVVVKGVERPAEHTLLERLGGDGAQGFLLSRPLPAGAAGAYLTATRAEVTGAGR